MNLKLSTLFVVGFILMWQADIIEGNLYLFLAEDEFIFQDCENQPDYLGVADLMDVSKLKIEVSDESVHIEGSIKVVWEADPDDRIELQLDVFKYDRGSWQPTVFTMVQKDFCSVLFKEQDVWFQSWGQFIDPEERKCINNKGVVYHHIPFDFKAVVDVTGEDVSGRHKLVIKIDAYKKIEKQPYSVCFQIPGDVIKI